DERKEVVGLARLVQATASGLVRIVPAPPVATNRSPNTPMPCKSCVVGELAVCQKIPSVLTRLVLSVPSALVEITLCRLAALVIIVPPLPTATARFVFPPIPRKMELVAASGGSSVLHEKPSELLRIVARSPTARNKFGKCFMSHIKLRVESDRAN